MHFDDNTLIAAGVFAHLLLALGKAVFTKPRDQARMDAIGEKADTILGEVRAVTALLPAVNASTAAAVKASTAEKGVNAMLVKSDISGLLLAGLKTQFFQTFTEMPAEYDKLCTVIPSDKDTEHYAWLGALPGMNEFKDERQVAEFSEYEYAIRNKTWESTVAIDRTAIEDDQYGQVALRVKGLAMEGKQHLDQITFGLLSTGFSAPCYDGLSFFHGAHPLGKNSNIPLTQGNAGTGALTSANLQAAVTAMWRTQNDQGRPMGVRPDTLVVPPELYWEAATLLNSAFYPDPVTASNQVLGENPLKGLLRLVTSPYLSAPSAWFLLDTKRAVRAIVLQMRREFEFSALEGNSEEGFLRDRYLYGVRARYNVGYGDWRCAYGSTGGS